MSFGAVSSLPCLYERQGRNQNYQSYASRREESELSKLSFKVGNESELSKLSFKSRGTYKLLDFFKIINHRLFFVFYC